MHTVINQQIPATNRKTLNIPICDVNVDQDYNKDVAPSFTLPTIYIKHQKRIGDEADVSLDYVIDKEDEVMYLSLFVDELKIEALILTFFLCCNTNRRG